MKKLIKFAFLGVAALGITLSGCSTEDQSSLNIGDITTFTTIVGTVTYSTGQGFQNGNFVDLVGNPQGRTVFAEVPNSAFVSGATGSRIFTTTVNADGTYEFEIPIAVSTIVNVNIFAEPFQAAFREFESLNEAGVPQFESTSALFRMNSQTVPVQRNNAHVRNLVYGHELLEREGVVFESFVTLSGRIGQAAARDTNISGTNDSRFYRLTGGLGVLLDVEYFDGNTWVADAARTFGATTNSEGVYTVTIPTLVEGEPIRVTLRGISFSGTYTHFFRIVNAADPSQPNTQGSRVLNGYFSAENIIVPAFTANSGITHHFTDLQRLRYNFTMSPPGQDSDVSPLFNANWAGVNEFVTQ